MIDDLERLAKALSKSLGIEESRIEAVFLSEGIYQRAYISQTGLLRVLIHALELRDPFTKGHSEKVATIAVGIYMRLGMSAGEVQQIEVASSLHDIGKIAVCDAVLRSNKRFKAGQMDEIRMHPVIGESVIEKANLEWQVGGIVRSHHERWDGRGYPDGKKNTEIPFGARVLAIADSFEAMTADRAYRKAMTEPEALKELERCAGGQFDPGVVEEFVKAYG